VTRRRSIAVAGVTASLIAWPLAAQAQQRLPVVGFVGITTPETSTRLLIAFREGLRSSGFSEGRNVTIEYRWAQSRLDRVPELAADLVGRNVTAIVACCGTPTVLRVKAATSTIPIVFHMGDDPVRVGVVESLNRPGGNITGVSFLTIVSGTKRLELLNALVPKATAVGLLVNPDNPGATTTMDDLRAAAATLGLKLHAVSANTARGIEEAFASMAQQHVGALFIAPDTLFRVQLAQIVALEARHAIPTMYATREFAEAGGLISYGADIIEAYRQVGAYAGRILKGTKPADLPVMQSTKFELVLNLKTAKSLGIAVPDKLLALAD